MSKFFNKKKLKEKLKIFFDILSKKYNNINISLVEKTTMILIFITTVSTAIFAVFIVTAIINESNIHTLEKYQMTIPTKIYDINNILISEVFIEKRDLITYNDLPQHLIEAIVAAEDTSFFRHPGIDLYGIARAAIKNIITLSKREGASTLTQQVARGVLLTREKTFIRKIKEVWITFQVERKYSKQEILTLYFNQIFFGHSVYGVQAATKFYFGKNVNDINLAEAALIASLPPSPNRYSPINNPNISMNRHKLVLNRMVDVNFISQEEADKSHEDFWATYTSTLKNKGSTAFDDITDHAPYITEYVKRILINKYGEKSIQENGLKIYTTIDLNKQIAAQQILTESLIKENLSHSTTTTGNDRIYERDILDRVDMLSLLFNIPYDIGENKFQSMVLRELNKTVLQSSVLLTEIFGISDANYVLRSAMRQTEDETAKKVEGALVSIDPRNGYIVSMVGGSGFTPRNQMNRVTQARRQAGSAFKPFLYSYALETRRFNTASIIIDAPIAFPMGDRYWTPANYSGTYLGPISFRRALRSSVNIVSVRILEALGVEDTIEYMKPIFNATDPNIYKRMFNEDLTLSLGTGLFSPLELTKGFAVFANKGKEVNPIMIRYVTDRYGIVIDDFEKDLQNEIAIKGGAQQVISEDVAYIITTMLRDVITGGTATRSVNKSEFRHPAAGKTGTSNDWKDAWFVGYTPTLVTGVWIGFDNFAYSIGRNRAGGTVSVPIWADYMKIVLEGEPSKWFSRPKDVITVTVCEESGLIPTADCVNTINEIFIRDGIPIMKCENCSNGYTGISDDEQYILDTLMEQLGGEQIYDDVTNDVIN